MYLGSQYQCMLADRLKMDKLEGGSTSTVVMKESDLNQMFRWVTVPSCIRVFVNGLNKVF